MHFIRVHDFEDGDCEKAINVAYIKLVEPRKLEMEDGTEGNGTAITMHDDEEFVVTESCAGLMAKLGL